MSGRKHHKFPSVAAEALAIALIGATLLGPALAEEPLPTDIPELPADIDASTSMGAMGSQEELSKLLPLLLTSEDRKTLAMELEAAVRQGDMRGAEKRLNMAIEMGTLAIMLVDRIQDPNLLPTLQSLGIRGENRPAPPAESASAAPAAGICSMDTSSSTANLLEMQEALDRESLQRSALSARLDAVTQEYHSLLSRQESDAATLTSKLSDLEATLGRERENGAAATRQLASLQAKHRTLQDEHHSLQDLQTRNAERTKGMVAELQSLVQQERDRGADALRQLTSTRDQLASAQEELRTLQAHQEQDAASGSARIVQLQEELSREKVRGDAATRELADAIETIEELRATQKRLEESVAQAQTAQTAPAPGSEPAGQKVASVAPMANLGLVSPMPPAGPSLPLIAPQPAEQAKPADAPDPGVVQAQPAPKPDDRLVVRAEELLRMGDVSGARLLLERSMLEGNAHAAFRLAETYDPEILSKIGVFGIRGDKAKARELYARARSLGIAKAGERMEALRAD